MSTNTITPEGSWLYSCNSSGQLQGRWRLTDHETETIQQRVKLDDFDHHLVEELAIEAIIALKQQASDHDKQVAKTALLDYLPKHDAITTADAKDWQQCLQVLVVDYALPGDNLMLTVFVLQQRQPLNGPLLERVVQQLVSSGGSCCGL